MAKVDNDPNTLYNRGVITHRLDAHGQPIPGSTVIPPTASALDAMNALAADPNAVDHRGVQAVSRDDRLDALRDMLIEGREAEALALVGEIAAETPKPTPLRRLREIQRDVHMATGRRIAIEVMVPDEHFVDLAEHITGGRTHWQPGDIEHRFVPVAPGIDVRGELAAARSARLPLPGGQSGIAAPRLSPEGQTAYDSLVRRFSTPRTTCSACGETGHDSTDHDL